MDPTYFTFLLFAAFSSLRMVSYLPQIYRVAVTAAAPRRSAIPHGGSGSVPTSRPRCTRSTTLGIPISGG